ncbi:hypothetical protein KEM48_012738 [Puccinia striiformis f. sp. tritici PST-130]|nr:hypothetical protein KEM48_012738 [Puccinia striiformis f. sp. tritici PST-130]
MRPTTPLPLVNGRPPGSGSVIRLRLALLVLPQPSSLLLGHPDPPDAVIEKHRLSTARRPFSILRLSLLTSLPILFRCPSRSPTHPASTNVFYPNYPNLALRIIDQIILAIPPSALVGPINAPIDSHSSMAS